MREVRREEGDMVAGLYGGWNGYACLLKRWVRVGVYEKVIIEGGKG